MLKVSWVRIFTKSESYGLINLATSYHRAIHQVATWCSQYFSIWMALNLFWCLLKRVGMIRIKVWRVNHHHRIFHLGKLHLIVGRIIILFINLVSITFEVIELRRWIMMIRMLMICHRISITLIYYLNTFFGISLLDQGFQTILLSHHFISLRVMILIYLRCRVRWWY